MNRPHLRPVSSSAASVRRPATPCAVSGRSGVTLTEVLMSLLVMGLGITSVFTLFPMSVLRSVKSTNLTNATLLSQSARDLFVANKSTLLTPPSPSTSTTYPKDTLLLQSPAVANTDIPEPFIGTFVVDPYGGANAGKYGATPGKFGERTPASTTDRWGVLRVAGFLASESTTTRWLGIDDVTSNDSWVTEFEEVPISIPTGSPNPYQIVFGSSDIVSSASSGSRVLILSANGRRSLTRSVDIGNSSGNTLAFTQTLPEDMDEVSEISKVRLQNYERRYTWLLTVHRDRLGGSTGQLVVFFRRGFGESEQLYPATINLQADAYGRQPKGEVIRVTNYTAGVPKPGDYIFGTWVETSGGQTQHHGRWYRIVRVTDQSGGDYEILLDRRWVGKTQPNNQPSVMFPQGVLSVFDL